MKCTWLRHTHSHRLLLIFAGWSTGPEFYANINRPGWDILVCHDFDDFEMDKSLLADYGTICLYAWSLGVYAASRVLTDVNLSMAVAICGSEKPCDDSWGIPRAIFQGTRENLNERNLQKFRRRMLSPLREPPCPFPETDDIEGLQNQLSVIEEESDMTLGNALDWSRVFIAAKDMIFPAESLTRYWESRLPSHKIVHLDAGHFVDINYIMSLTMPDNQVVGESFRNAASRYDDHASAQQIIAAKLTDMVAETIEEGERFDRVLEVGQGTGLLSRLIMPVLRPEEVDYVDLYATRQWGLAAKETYSIMDAESFLERTEEQWDAIVSSSAVQWFADFEGFIRNASRCLKTGGLLACTTFSVGNLGELDSVRPSPLVYLTENEIAATMRKHFADVEVKSETLTLRFATGLQALAHLRHTGVSVKRDKNVENQQSIGRLLEALTRDSEGAYCLTYRPVYIIARQPRT